MDIQNEMDRVDHLINQFTPLQIYAAGVVSGIIIGATIGIALGALII